MTASPPDLPAAFGRIAARLGLPLALRIETVYGGQDLSIPKRPGDDHHLVKSLGREDADALAAAYGPNKSFYVPRVGERLKRAARDRAIIADADGGMTANRLAKKYGLCAKQIKNIVNAPAPAPIPGHSGEASPAQLPLF